LSDFPTVPAVAPQTASETRTPKRGPRGIVTIYGKWCKGCGLCVEFCPTGVLALDTNDHPYVAQAEKCSACHWCDTHCPDLAIIVTPVVA
jgi:2-oxoglutarate ferredoxin oxidoreductase subunit delta